MKKTFTIKTHIALFAIALFFSCSSENGLVTPVTRSGTESGVHDEYSVDLRMDATGFVPYAACNKLIKLFNPPSASYYTVAGLTGNNTYKKFGVASDNRIVFDKIDIIRFEFSGKYTGKGNTVKLYHIRRNDGLYLTKNANWMFTYTTKSTNPAGSSSQLFILNDLGNNKFNIILPTLPDNCGIAYFNYDGDAYRFTIMQSNASYAGMTLLIQQYIKANTN